MDHKYLFNEIKNEIENLEDDISRSKPQTIIIDELCSRLGQRTTKGVYIIIGPPGIGKSYTCNQVKINLEKKVKIKYVDVAENIREEEALGRKIETFTNIRVSTILMLDNFDRVFTYSHDKKRGNWTSLHENRPGIVKFQDSINAFIKKDGAKLVIVIQDETYYRLRDDINSLHHRLEKGDDWIVRALGVPNKLQDLGYLYNSKYHEYLASILDVVFEQGFDEPLAVFLAKLAKKYSYDVENSKRDVSEGFSIDFNSFKKLIFNGDKIDVVNKLCSRLGLFYIPSDDASQEKIVSPSKVIDEIEKRSEKLNLFPSEWQKIKTRFWLGFPPSFVLISSIIFGLGLTDKISNIPIFIFIFIVFLAWLIIAYLFGYWFDKYE